MRSPVFPKDNLFTAFGSSRILQVSRQACRVDWGTSIWSNLRMDTRGRVLAMDYGEKNIGFACSDALGMIVRPLPSIPNSGRKDLTRKLRSMVEELDARTVVVGIPLHMDGSRNDSVCRIERLIERLKAALDLPIVGVDERLSTVEAAEYWNQMTLRQQKKYRTIDSLAAALILDRYLKEQ